MKIVLCHGKFDVLHAGHIAFLEKAKTYGNTLVVSITADAYLSAPAYFNEQERKKALEALSCVDEVYICLDKTGVNAINKYRPDIYAKGPDYVDSQDQTLLQERTAVERCGGRLEIIKPDITFSSTKIKNKHHPFIDIFGGGYSVNLVVNFIQQVKTLKVMVVGETIVDAFQIVELDGQSAKSSCSSFTVKSDVKEQQGGAGVIKRHLENFCSSVKLLTNNYTIGKLRYIDRFHNKKHFEIKIVEPNSGAPLQLSKIADVNLTLIADFGHGLFVDAELRDGIYLMVQTNSSNFGYNLASKWNKYKSKLVCLDRVEGSLLTGRKFETADEKLMQEIYKQLNTEAVILTMHKYGSVYYDGENYETFPALALNTVDTIGAGDAFFTFASLAYHLKYSPKQILLIASIAAAITTQWLCNESSVTAKKLLETAKIIL